MTQQRPGSSGRGNASLQPTSPSPPPANAPDVLDVDQRGQGGSGFTAYSRLPLAGLPEASARSSPLPAAACTPTSPAAPRQPADPPTPPRLQVPWRVCAHPAVPGQRQALSAHCPPGGVRTLDWSAVAGLLDHE